MFMILLPKKKAKSILKSWKIKLKTSKTEAMCQYLVVAVINPDYREGIITFILWTKFMSFVIDSSTQKQFFHEYYWFLLSVLYQVKS